jgi:hypothetical protein
MIYSACHTGWEALQMGWATGVAFADGLVFFADGLVSFADELAT